MDFLYLLLLLSSTFVCRTVSQKTVVSNHTECGQKRIDLAFLLDSSGSIGTAHFQRLKDFLIDFLDQNAINAGYAKVAIVSFSTEARVDFYFDEYDTKEGIKEGIRNIDYIGFATNITGAHRLARMFVFNEDNGDRPDVNDMLVIASDGQSTTEGGKRLKQEINRWRGKGTKNIPIFGLGIGPEYQIIENRKELKSIVTPAEKGEKENVIFVESFEDLQELKDMIFDRICRVIQKTSTVIPGDRCYVEGQIVTSKCKRFKCIGGFWDLTYTGCLFDGCMEWEEEKMVDCLRYKCFRKGECLDAERKFCIDYDVRLTNVGCRAKGVCREENSTWGNNRTCEEYQCVRGIDKEDKPVGIAKTIDTDCVDPDGKCRDIGYRYSTSCVGFQCERVVDDGKSVVKFVTYEAGCRYKGKCVPVGDTIEEDCDIHICEYDDSSQSYDFVLDTRRCSYGGDCYEIDETWENKTTCTKFKCVFDAAKNKTFNQRRVTGCKGAEGCINKGTEITKDKCIDYKCNSKGDFELVSAGCPVGNECKEVNSTWRLPGVCAHFTCRLGELTDTYVQTKRVKEIECHGFNSECLKVGDTTTEKCITYICQPTGKLKRTEAGCHYKGKCYKIKEKWTDKTFCKRYVCEPDPTTGAVYFGLDYGCIDEDNVCYKPGESRSINGSCVTEICGEDHIFRPTLCEYRSKCYEMEQNWIDKTECVRVMCLQDPVTGSAYIDTSSYGCRHNSTCYDPGANITIACQTFQCIPEGKGFEPIYEECIVGNSCKAVGEKWFDKDECVKYVCKKTEEGVSEEKIIYGCVDEYRDKCWRSGAVVENDGCIKFKCVNGSIEALKIGCKHGDICINVSQTLKDPNECTEYKCVIDEQSPGYIKTSLKEKPGCLDHEACYWAGQIKEEACVTYKCVNQKFKVIDAQCPWRGGCKYLRAEWQHEKKCLTYACRLKEGSEIPRVVRILWGCMDDKGKCHKFGTKIKVQDCLVHQCQRRRGYGLGFYPIEIGCKFRQECKKLEEMWVNKRRCVKQICLYGEGSSVPEVFDSPYGCRSSRKCYPFGAVITDEGNSCVKYECTKYEIFSPVEVGCPYNGKCKRERARWVDKDKCVRYKCKREMIGPSQVVMHTIKEKGCHNFDGTCMWAGDTVTRECTKYQCNPYRDGLVIVNEECEYKDVCKALNSTWFEPETCTDYQCIYSQDKKDIVVREKTTGCQDDGGRCYVKGEEREEQCTKFVCNKNSNFKPVEIGCEWRRKCYKLNETWTRNCVKYTCRLVSKGKNVVETHVDASHGCVCESGGCFLPGETRKHGCLEYVCREGGDFELSSFACYTDEGCLKPGKFYKKDCIEYKCSAKTQALVPVNNGCEWKGECKELDSKWFDRETCRGFKCAYSPIDNDVRVIERTAGCRDEEGQCMKSGRMFTNTNDCIKYKCYDGEFVPTEVGCLWGDRCVPVGTSWRGECCLYQCEVIEQGPTFIETAVRLHHGCRDCFGMCYLPGEFITNGCTRMECMWGGYFQTTNAGCMGKYGECIAIGDYVDYGMQKKECVADGYLQPVELPTGCYDGKFKFYTLGSYIEEGCEKFQCQLRGYSAKFYSVQKGCLYKKKCRAVGDKWAEKDGCIYYTCTTQQSSVGTQQTYVTKSYGCFDNENKKCRENGESWFDGCMEMRCDVTKSKKNKVTKKITIASGGCRQNLRKGYTCHDPGEIWSEVRENMCLQLKCQLRKNNYISRVQKPLCRDVHGQCREVGDIGFNARIDGKLHRDCKCKLRRKQIQYICRQ